jgi:lipoprotein NlpD
MNRNGRALLAGLVAILGAGCMSQPPAPVSDRRPTSAAQQMPPSAQTVPSAGGAASSPAPQRTYIVKRGDTLYSIALENGADFRELAQWNNLEDSAKIRIGQELRVSAPAVTAPDTRTGVQVGAARLPGEVEARPLGSATGPAASPSASPTLEGGMRTSPKALRLPYSEQNLALLSRPDGRADVKPAEVRPAELKPEAPTPAVVERPADALDFVWPAKGRVIAGFSEPRNKGVDIEARAGDPVVAAAAGRVIYVGSGIPGLGKFIVVRHENGFNTVYAHNRENLVKMDQNIARGQKIAEVGNTDADTPKLHFQIRKFGTPLDPQKYLPPS